VGVSTALDAAKAAMRLADVDPAQAMAAAAVAVRAARRERDTAASALAEQAWGLSLLQCAEVDAAVRHLRRAASLGEAAQSWDVVGRARMRLGFALVQRGQLPAALREIDAALHVLDGDDVAIARAQRGTILYQTGRLEDAFADFQAAIPLLRKSDNPLGLQRALVNRGIVHAERHEFAAAEADLLEADRFARQLGRELAVGIIAENLGFNETLRGDVPAALAHFDRAERTISEHKGQVAPLLQDRGELLLSVGLAAEARAAAQRAVIAYRRERRQLKVPESRLLLAQAAFLDRDWAGARTQATLASREFRRQQRVGWAELARVTALRAALADGAPPRIGERQMASIVDTLVHVGWPAAAVEARLVAARLATLRGRSAQAQLTQAGRSRRSGPAQLRARAWYAEALLRSETGDRRGAIRATRTGLRLLDEHAAALGATDLRVHSAAHRGDLTELGLRMAMRDGRPAQVFEWAERGRASRLLFRLVRPPHDPVLADLLVEVRAVASEIARSERQSVAGQVHRQVVLERQIRDHCRMHGSGSAPVRTDPVPLGALRTALADRALVQFVQFDEVQHALTLVDGRLRLRALATVTETAGLLERLPFALHRMAHMGVRKESTSAAVTLLRATARRLDDMLLRPLPEIRDRALVVVPTGVLHSLPWSILPSCAGRAVAVSPSATLWHETRTRVRDGGGQVLVAAGPQLPGGRAEALAVAAIHGVPALVDDAASAPAVLAGLAGAGLVHLAAHGRLSSENPLFSSLLLSDGPLVVHDLEQLPRLPATVVLAACDSGRSVVRAGDELLGLGATFLARGSAELIASVVPVPDAETAPLMVALHRSLAAGVDPAEALARAQRDVPCDDPAAVAAAAGFICLGAG
jgi:tetratricopeptide (TPR) repeat protein